MLLTSDEQRGGLHNEPSHCCARLCVRSRLHVAHRMLHAALLTVYAVPDRPPQVER